MTWPMRRISVADFDRRARRGVAGLACVLLLAALILAAPMAAAPAKAQQTLGIAAVVNDAVISHWDLEERLRLAIALSNLPDSSETRRRLAPEVLRRMIDEKLKLQATNRRNIEVDSASINDALRRIVQINRIPNNDLDSFLQRINISREAILEQVRVDLAWNRLIRDTKLPAESITDQDVTETLDRLRANLGKEERLLAEIFLRVEDPSRDRETRALAEQMVDQFQNGADFGSLAAQFSQSPTAALGGDLGWVPPGQLGDKLDAAAARLAPGQVSPPVRTLAGYHILFLRDTRTRQPDQAVYDLSQILIPGDLPADERATVVAMIREEALSCAAMNRLADNLGLPASGPVSDIAAEQMPPPIRNAVAGLPVQSLSEPITLPEGTLYLIVCQKTTDDLLPSRAEIRERLEVERLERVSQQTLRDLRRQAIVDVRL